MKHHRLLPYWSQVSTKTLSKFKQTNTTIIYLPYRTKVVYNLTWPKAQTTNVGCPKTISTFCERHRTAQCILKLYHIILLFDPFCLPQSQPYFETPYDFCMMQSSTNGLIQFSHYIELRLSALAHEFLLDKLCKYV